jgi:hypothetical protein
MKNTFAKFAAVLVGSLASLGCGGGAAPGSSTASSTSSMALRQRKPPPAPKPIAGGDFFPDMPSHRAGIIHQWYPIDKMLGGDGFYAEPNGMTDFKGFVAQVFQGGSAVDSNGTPYDVDIDSRVYVGDYIAVDGSHQFGAFCEI